MVNNTFYPVSPTCALAVYLLRGALLHCAFTRTLYTHLKTPPIRSKNYSNSARNQHNIALKITAFSSSVSMLSTHCTDQRRVCIALCCQASWQAHTLPVIPTHTGGHKNCCSAHTSSASASLSHLQKFDISLPPHRPHHQGSHHLRHLHLTSQCLRPPAAPVCAPSAPF